MNMINDTLVKEFLLLGFEGHLHFKALLFFFFLFVYIIILFGNILIIVLIKTYQSLHSPMYIFLCNLSLSDIFITTNVIPNLLAIIPEGRRPISFDGCVTQLFFHGMLVTTECLFLTVMAYDRKLAICKPLHYILIMEAMLYRYIILVWISGGIIILIPVLLLLPLSFCGPNVIDHFFCDLDPILALTCSDTFIIRTEAFIMSISVTFLAFGFIIYSYVRILLTILRIPSTGGRQKTFSTCSAHLLAVCTYFLTIISVYAHPSQGSSSNLKKLQSFLYIVGTPFFNPIIYTLRNKEIKSSTRKLKIALFTKKG